MPFSITKSAQIRFQITLRLIKTPDSHLSRRVFGKDVAPNKILMQKNALLRQTT